jgi:hypothetical protein
VQIAHAASMQAHEQRHAKSVVERASYKLRRVRDYAGFAWNQRVRGFTVPDRPDFDDFTIPLMAARLAKTRNYLEFGSGASSVLAAKQGVAFTSVETDRHYLAAVRRKVAAAGLSDPAKQRFIHADIGLTEYWGAPLFKRPTPARVARWRAYAEAPWRQGAPKPDFILVDGRFRAACTLTAIKHLGQGDWELWLDDYVGRDHYSVVQDFAVLERMSGVTAIFRARSDLDAGALEAAIDAACQDWR